MKKVGGAQQVVPIGAEEEAAASAKFGVKSLGSPNNMIRKTSAYGNEAPWSRAKTGKKLHFADEKGCLLHHVTYSDKTHYSRVSVDEAATGRGGCCIIS